MDFLPIATVPADAVEQLLDRAFGPDRHGRTAYAIRAGTSPLAEFSFAAVENGMLIGTIQCWPVRLLADKGGEIPLVMVGPVAVEPSRQQDGIGRALMRRALDAGDMAGADALMLIGDPEYYGRFFGFSAERTGKWRVPGPVEQRRLLARGAGVPDQPGVLAPSLPVAA